MYLIFDFVIAAVAAAAAAAALLCACSQWCCCLQKPTPLVSSGNFIVRLRLARSLQPAHWKRPKPTFTSCLVDKSPGNGKPGSAHMDFAKLTAREKERIQIVVRVACLRYCLFAVCSSAWEARLNCQPVHFTKVGLTEFVGAYMAIWPY